MFYKVKINLLLLLICSYLSGGLCSFESYASTVNNIQNKEISLNLEQLEQSNKNKPKLEETIVINSLFYSPSFIQTSNFTQTPKNIIKSKDSSSSQNTPFKQNAKNTNLFPSLYSQTKQILKESKGNEALQNTLIIFSQTRQFLKETDLMLHNLTQDILAYLNLDPSNNQSLLVLTESKITPHSDSNYKAPSNNFRQQLDINRIENLKQQNNQEKWDYSDNAIFALIFNLQNLYYLIAFVVLVGVVKQTIKLVFLKDQYDSQNRR